MITKLVNFPHQTQFPGKQLLMYANGYFRLCRRSNSQYLNEHFFEFSFSVKKLLPLNGSCLKSKYISGLGQKPETSERWQRTKKQSYRNKTFTERQPKMRPLARKSKVTQGTRPRAVVNNARTFNTVSSGVTQ